MTNEAWQKFMQRGDYKKYQLVLNRNRPYVDKFQRDLMEKYELCYFREHPLEDELNKEHGKLTIKFDLKGN